MVGFQLRLSIALLVRFFLWLLDSEIILNLRL